MFARKRATFEDVQDYYFTKATDLVADSICVMLLAMNEELGIGKVRVKRVIERYMKINRHYNDYQDDTRRQIEIKQRLAELDLTEYADFLLSKHTIQGYHREMKQQNQVSVVEAAKMQEQLQIMKSLMNK